jgi:DNA-binding response OmpR family regulator
VARLRRKLDERDGPRWIETVRGMGYRFADR